MSIYLGPDWGDMSVGYGNVCSEIYNRARHLGVVLEDECDWDRKDHVGVGFDSVGNLVLAKNDSKDFSDVKIVIHLGLFEEFIFENYFNGNDCNYFVCFMFWETSILPVNMVRDLNFHDEVWTCSDWAKQVFIDSGVTKPIYVFNLGFDPSIFKIKNNFDRGDQPFTYLHIGGDAVRKNAQLVIDSFLKLHDGDMGYRLILKSNGRPLASVGELGQFGCYTHPQIEVIDYRLNHEDMVDLYHSADCFVYPTTGEGWGLSPFTAIACGIPTICTNISACQEYAFLSVPLDCDFVETNHNGMPAGYAGSPSLEAVCERMLYVENNYKEVVNKTHDGAVFLKENYTFDNAIGKIVDRIKLLKELYDN
jgi:glycosyltransferase involved in cell wall biosynthesis